MIRRISVFCGSGSGSDPAYTNAAKKLGALLVKKDIGLVYGGGKIGLMGVIAGIVLKYGGRVTGVIPQALAEKEVAYTELSDLRIVTSMHERKALIADISDAFIAMPGGFGTLDEIFEALTWAQLGIHHKPCGILNVSGYFDHLLKFIDHAIAQEFVHMKNKSLLLVDDDPVKLMDKIEAYKPVRVDKANWALGNQD
jgi:uncharacterized protein (TIGR00730 family)